MASPWISLKKPCCFKQMPLTIIIKHERSGSGSIQVLTGGSQCALEGFWI